MPLVPFNLLNYALGLTRIRIGPYVIASLVCMIPGTVASTWLGHAGRERPWPAMSRPCAMDFWPWECSP